MTGETFPLPVRWVRFAYPPYENHTFPPTFSAERGCEGVVAAALWPRAGIVKGAAASPLNTFARGKATESARALANGTVHRAYIVALHASCLPAGRARNRARMPGLPMAGETLPLPVRWVRFAYPPYENHTFPPTFSAERGCEGVVAAALWPRAGIVKGAAASPLNTFARGKATESARALANGTVHRAYIVALHASCLPAGRARNRARMPGALRLHTLQGIRSTLGL